MHGHRPHTPETERSRRWFMNKALLAGGVAAVATMTGCSNGSSDTASSSSAAPSGGAPSGMPSGGPGAAWWWRRRHGPRGLPGQVRGPQGCHRRRQGRRRPVHDPLDRCVDGRPGQGGAGVPGRALREGAQVLHVRHRRRRVDGLEQRRRLRPQGRPHGRPDRQEAQPRLRAARCRPVRRRSHADPQHHEAQPVPRRLQRRQSEDPDRGPLLLHLHGHPVDHEAVGLPVRGPPRRHQLLRAR